MPQRFDSKAVYRQADVVACRAHLGAGSRSFLLASRLLPRRVSARATVLYAFCRLADDAVDRNGTASSLAGVRDVLDRAYAGRPADDPVERAFARLVCEQGLPRRFPEALIEGFAWDLEGRRYPTIAALEAYAARVAGSVGAMMAWLMDVRDRATIARACDLGLAMQLSNIARDIAEDARLGRLYLPERWLDEAGLAPESLLAGPVWDARLRRVTARLLAHADRLYARAEAGLAGLPLACRPGIYAARLLYADIGRAVLRPGHDPIAKRSVVPRGRKLALAAKATTGWAALGRETTGDARPAAAFLVDAAAAAGAAHTPRPFGIEGRVAWLLELFERLERLERRAGKRSAAAMTPN